MAEIKDCIGKNVKISKTSITIKDENGKTCGVVRNIISVRDMQANKQIDYYHLFRKMGLHGKISTENCLVKDDELYVFRDMRGVLFHEKHGYFSDYEREKAKEEAETFRTLRDSGIEVIECVLA